MSAHVHCTDWGIRDWLPGNIHCYGRQWCHLEQRQKTRPTHCCISNVRRSRPPRASSEVRPAAASHHTPGIAPHDKPVQTNQPTNISCSYDTTVRRKGTLPGLTMNNNGGCCNIFLSLSQLWCMLYV